MQDRIKLGAASLRPSAEELELIQRWRYPDVEDESQREDDNSTNALGMRSGEWRRPEPEAEEEAPQPPTAEEIEAIRQAAYEEGFEEGKQAGQKQGYQEGLKNGFEEGHQQGLEQGNEEGQAQGKAIIDEKASALDALIRQLHAPLANVDTQVEQSLLRLVSHLAEEVIRTELATNPDVILKVLHEAISVLPLNTGSLTIDLHPDDLALVQQQYDAEMAQERGWLLRAEPALSRGDINIASERSYVDVSMKQRVKDLMERFLHQSVPKVEMALEPVHAPTLVSEEKAPEETAPEKNLHPQPAAELEQSFEVEQASADEDKRTDNAPAT